MTAQNRNLKEREEHYSPLANSPHPITSLLDDRTSKFVESLREGVWLINRKARTVFVHHCLAGMLHYDVEEMIGQSLCPFCGERFTDTLRHNQQWRRFGVAEPYDCKLGRKATGPGISGNLDTVFQPVRTTKARKVGLNLTVCKRIAKGYGGRIGCGECRRESRSLTLQLPIIDARQMKEGGVLSWKVRPS